MQSSGAAQFGVTVPSGPERAHAKHARPGESLAHDGASLTSLPQEALSHIMYMLGKESSLSLRKVASFLLLAWRAIVRRLDCIPDCYAGPLKPADLRIIALFALLEHLKARTGDAAGDIGALAQALPNLTSVHLSGAGAYRLLNGSGASERCSRLRDLELEDEQHVLIGLELVALATLSCLTSLKLLCSRVDSADRDVQHISSQLVQLRSLSLQASAPADLVGQLPAQLTALTALTLLQPRKHELGTQLASLSNLQRLETTYHRLPDGTEQQRQAFAGLSKLTFLALPESERRGQLHSAALLAMTQLVELRAPCFSLQPAPEAEPEAGMDALFSHPSLRHVELRTLAPLPPALRGQAATGCLIESLTLGAECMGLGIEDTDLANLPFLPHLKSLVVLNVMACDDEYAWTIGALANHSGTLEQIKVQSRTDLYKSHMRGPDTLDEEFLEELPRCRVLDLLHMPCTTSMLGELAACEMPALEELKLSFVVGSWALRCSCSALLRAAGSAAPARCSTVSLIIS